MTSPNAALERRLGAVTIGDRNRLARRMQRAGRDPETAGRRWDEIAEDLGRAEAVRARRAASVPPVSYPPDLPVSARREEVLEAIGRHQVVVVAGETGSGKTTQIPKMCLELGRGVDGMIGHTQPRRIAARTVAERVAEELSVPLGGAVGYAVRFDDTVGEETLVKVMTDGILLAEIRHDRLLTAYDTIIVDEAHERSLSIDFLLGYLTRLLPQRPDLKVVITSATIDTARFAAHFHAPVVEVSGRTYPVEVRYRPLTTDDEDEGRDINGAICEAVAELAAAGPGDVLVFLPGERDIRDAADALRQSSLDGLEILPLYARLSAAEHHRVFRPHAGRRVVLATNVAETSLTVPGIRYVVDTGLARISRFNRRTKVQRLPIEAVSRASADQRAGRCGRVAPGICIRLYAEDDYQGRPEFTEPEILRTNLASVLLQMAAIGLGDVDRFPFLDPPDRRSVADGRLLLQELGALRGEGVATRLTTTGRRLAELPLDPRLARMVVEAEARHCLREVTVIAAALSIQDPRERPADQLAAARAMHERFAVPGSDFLGMLALWEYLSRLQEELSGNRFRRRCREEFLNPLRVREWQDVAGQIRQAYRSRGVHANDEPAAPEHIHQALLAGLLSHLGMRDGARGDYQGARAVRWQVGRDSVLARHPPPWAMAGELMETGRIWGRTVARVDPAWAETLGAHLVKRSYSEPWWDPGRGEAVVEERVTLYGLPVVAGRRSSLARTDAAAARHLFIRHALVEGDWPPAETALATTRERIDQVLALEQRVRRRDLLAPDDVIFEYFDSRLPPEVTTGRRFERWWRRVARDQPGLLDVPFSVLVDRSAGPVDVSAYPDTWQEGELQLPLRYRFAPGAPDDGVTVKAPITVLNRLRADSFDWNVPGFRRELVTALIRALPKAQRRALGSAASAAEEVLAAGAGPADGPLADVVARRVAQLIGEPVTLSAWDLSALPDHLRVNFELVTGDGHVRWRGRDLAELQRALAGEVRSAIAQMAPALERHGETGWVFGDIPRQMARGPARGYPCLVDEGDSVGLTVVESAAVQAENMWLGTRRLLLLAVPLNRAGVQRRLTNRTKLAMARSAADGGDLLADCASAAVDEIVVGHGGPPFDAAGFEAVVTATRRRLEDRVVALATAAAAVLDGARHLEAALTRLERSDRGGVLAPALGDVRRQLDRLAYPGFVAVAGPRLDDLSRYLEAAGRRLDRLPADARRDAERMAVVCRVEERYDLLADRALAPGAPAGLAAGLADVRWMIEELRVSLWAQALGTRGPVSEARIMRTLHALDADG